MTRINLLPRLLPDIMLRAAAREHPRVIKYAKIHAVRPYSVSDKFILNSGHVLFFVNKFRWIAGAQLAIINEMIMRRDSAAWITRAMIGYDRIMTEWPVVNHCRIEWHPNGSEIGLWLDRVCSNISLMKTKPTWNNRKAPSCFKHLAKTLAA